MPTKLIDQIQDLEGPDACRSWSTRVLDLLNHLVSLPAEAGETAQGVLTQLGHELTAVAELIEYAGETPLATDLRRVEHALRRRLAVWQVAAALGPKWHTPAASGVAIETLRRHVASASAATQGNPQGASWEQYLLLDALRQAADGSSPEEDLAHLIRRVLARLDDARLNPLQRALIAQGPFAPLNTLLHGWTTRPTEPSQLLQQLERYEQAGRVSEGKILAEQLRQLRWSDDPAQRELAQAIEDHYLGTNVRAAISVAFLDRLLPAPTPVAGSVRDTILGRPVRGTKQTATQLGVRLIPDPHQWRLVVEGEGDVSAWTTAFSGRVSVESQSESTFTVRQEFVVRGDDILALPADATAHTRSRLRRVDTPLDDVPLLGPMYAAVVESQYERNRSDARREAECKVAAEARRRVAEESQRAVKEAKHRVEQHVLLPLKRLHMATLPVYLQTTPERLVLRTRINGADQLGAHTPRPRALGNSLLSVQIHESAFNNAAEGFDLDGRTFDMDQLFKWVAGRLNWPTEEPPDLTREDVQIVFAEQDAIRARFTDGRVQLTLQTASIRRRRRDYPASTVRVYYRPAPSALSATLIRDGTVQLAGDRLGTRAQFALRGIFSKVFSRNRQWDVLARRLVEDPRLADLEVTQFVIDDGWIGLSVGPKHQAARPHVADRGRPGQ